MIDAEFGGPDVGRRAAVYTAARLSHETATLIESMVRRAGARTVGKGALGNVVTRFDSVKNGRHRILESHTCELVHAYELELDPDVLGYYVQVPCDAIERTNANGRRHLSAAHIDFLVFRRTSVQLIECKQIGWLQRKALDRNPDWVFERDEWTCLPYRQWASEHGIPFHVWQGPLHPAVYLSNLTVVYGALRANFSTPDAVLCRRASALLLSGPLSIAELTRNIPGFTPRTAAQMLSKRFAYGPWRTVSLSDDLGFILFSSPEQASAFDHECSKGSADTFRSLDLRKGLLVASAVDVAKARERLFAVEELLRGRRPPTRRLKELAKTVLTARETGGSTLEACLTHYSRSGNRMPRLAAEYSEICQEVVSEFWDKGKALSLSDLCEVYASFCVERGLPVLGIGALKSSVRQRDGTKRALSTGGLRKFQSVRKNTDPRFTSAAPLQYGALAFIDSTPIDMRFVEPGSDKPLRLASTFYIAMDGATGYPLGFSFVFGPSRTEGLAILMRVMVRRNGFLPRMLHLDRGSENTSEWIRAFSEGRISLRYSPTAGSPWNQGAETALRFANAQVSHRMFGSTLPDREKRSVDGRFKSLRTARMQFSDLHAELSRYIDDELPHLPAADGSSAVERKNDVIERFGVGGAVCRLDDDFMLSTSVTLRQAHKPTARGSIRIEEGTYTSQELQGLLRRRNKIDEVRLDCENPDILYCKLQGEWAKAFHRRIQDHATYPLHHGLFDLCFGATSRKLARKVRGALGSERRKRADHVRKMVIEREKAPEDQPPKPSKRSTRRTPKPVTSTALYKEEK